MVAILVVSSVPMHASLGQSMHKGARTVLQGISGNPWQFVGGVAAITTLKMFCVYNDERRRLEGVIEHYREKQKYDFATDEKAAWYNNKIQNNQKRLQQWKSEGVALAALVVCVASGASYYFAKACGWAGSKIK